ncbi:peroxiredoxin family protein [Halorubrum sp. DTA98]|uniref:peroxiredoxin family protein n=1 Tax=Halorubrum sp. DTA98 TaxID=3402163 RepID=UPI003AAAD902
MRGSDATGSNATGSNATGSNATGDGSRRSSADFTLPNGGPGPDPFTLSALPDDLAVVVFHRDHLCGNCRRQAMRLARHREEFRERNTAVVSVLPEPVERAAAWADRRDAPLPTLADPDSAVAERYGQPTRFGRFGARIDLLGRMPLAALVDLRGEPEILWRHAGTRPGDRPTIDDLLTEIAKFS